MKIKIIKYVDGEEYQVAGNFINPWTIARFLIWSEYIYSLALKVTDGCRWLSSMKTKSTPTDQTGASQRRSSLVPAHNFHYCNVFALVL